MATNDLTSDALQQLLLAVSQKDEKAFETLYAHFRPILFPFVWNMLRDHALTEDVIAETMFGVLRSSGTYAAQAKVSTWVHQIARNKAVDLIRKLDREPTTVQIDDPELLELPDTTPWGDMLAEVDRRQAVLRLDECMGHLTDKQRTALTLVKLEGLTEVEAAQTLDIPEGTVKSQIFAARALLGKCLQRWYKEMKRV